MKEPAYEKIGIVDSQWIVHQFIPSLGSQGKEKNGKSPLEGVRKLDLVRIRRLVLFWRVWSCLNKKLGLFYVL